MSPASTLPALLQERAARQGDDTAFIFLDDGGGEAQRLTYAALDREARRVAARLQPVAERARALLLYPPGLDYVAAFFGCLYAGAIAVPAYPPDPTRLSRTLPRLQAIIDDCAPELVLTTGAIAALAPSLSSLLPGAAQLRFIATDGPGELAGVGLPPIAPERIAFLQYTSGSTSAPKGVVLTHANLMRNQHMIAEAFPHDAETVVVGWLPLYHDMGLIGDVLHPIFLGRPCVLMSPLAFLKRPLRWLAAISRYGASTSGGPNFAYDLCTRKVSDADLATLDLSRWRVAFSGAETVRADTLARFAERFSRCGFSARAFSPCYGLAEATLIVSGGGAAAARTRTFSRDALASGRAADDRDGVPLVSCGRALAGERIVIVDPDTRRCLADGTVGEIWVQGEHVAAGYWGRRSDGDDGFGARLADGDGPFLRSGDLGFLRDGELYVTGRRKELIIIRGRNHYPQDIERTVERSHRGFRPGCGAAFAVEGKSEERLVVVHEFDPAHANDVAAARAVARQAVSEEHQLQLDELVLLRPGTLPKTSSGKIQRRPCRDALARGDFAADVIDCAPLERSHAPC